MHIRSPKVYENAGKKYFSWENSNLCHSNDYWYDLLFELKSDEEELNAGRFFKYIDYWKEIYKPKPKVIVFFKYVDYWKNLFRLDKSEQYDENNRISADIESEKLEEIIEWFSNNIKDKWSIVCGPTYDGKTSFWFKDILDLKKFKEYTSQFPKIPRSIPIPPLDILNI